MLGIPQFAWSTCQWFGGIGPIISGRLSMLIRPNNANSQSPTRWLPECGCLKIKDPPLIILQIFDFRNPIDLRSAPKSFQAYQTFVWGDTLPSPLTTVASPRSTCHRPGRSTSGPTTVPVCRVWLCQKTGLLCGMPVKPSGWGNRKYHRIRLIKYWKHTQYIHLKSFRYCNLNGFIEVVF